MLSQKQLRIAQHIGLRDNNITKAADLPASVHFGKPETQ